MDPTGEDAVQPSSVEINISNAVKTLFKENTKAASEKGVLRWNLYQTVQTHPSCNVKLVKKLVKQLQKCIAKLQMFESAVRVIPILHTLYYVVLQSPVLISPRLYRALYTCLMRLLVLPLPYCAVALSTQKRIKLEMFTPGASFHRRVIAEQSLNNDHLKLHERVFLLVDPELVSGPLEAMIRADLEVGSSLRDPVILRRNILLRLLQSALGTYCHSPMLRRALEGLGDEDLDNLFQETVAAVEEGVRRGPEGWKHYIDDLKTIYAKILKSTHDVYSGHEDNTVYSIPLPYPEIHFIQWQDEDNLWDVLTSFSLNTEQSKDRSMRSKDVMGRRKAYKKSKSGSKLSLVNDKMERSSYNSSSTRPQRSHTARIVVMGDDRILGKLACAYRNIQEKESKHVMLTKKMKLEFYYVPLADAELSLSPQPETPVQEDPKLSIASFLGQIDSWYDENINSLHTVIPKLSRMTTPSRPSEQSFLLDTLCYYLRCGTQTVNFPLSRVMMTRCCDGASRVIEEAFVSSLEADVSEFKHLKDKSTKSYNRRKRSVEVFGGVLSVSYSQTLLSKREVVRGACPMACGAVITSERFPEHGENNLGVRFTSVKPEESTKFFTKSISLKAMENRTLIVCLDKDQRRTYSNIQRVEVCPYMDPGCNIQRRFSVIESKKLPLAKYVNKVLSLPINTFSGMTS